jgi:hypothetical protein
MRRHGLRRDGSWAVAVQNDVARDEAGGEHMVAAVGGDVHNVRGQHEVLG